MTDNIDKPQGGDADKPQGGTDGQAQGASDTTTSIDLAAALKKIDDLERDNKKYRDERKKQDTELRKQQEQQMAEQQQWQKLAETRGVELEKLKPVADQYETIQAAFNASLDTRLKEIPEDVRKDIVDPVRAVMSATDFSTWLDKNLPRLRGRQAPPLDGGAGTIGGGKAAPQLTAAELEVARAMGLTPEVYAKRKAEIQAMPGRRITQEELDAMRGTPNQ